jgi:hypothetical protein
MRHTAGRERALRKALIISRMLLQGGLALGRRLAAAMSTSQKARSNIDSKILRIEIHEHNLDTPSIPMKNTENGMLSFGLGPLDLVYCISIVKNILVSRIY